MGYDDLKYRSRFSTSIDKNLLAAFKDLAESRRQPLSWVTDDAIEDYLQKNGVTVVKASEEKKRN